MSGDFLCVGILDRMVLLDFLLVVDLLGSASRSRR